MAKRLPEVREEDASRAIRAIYADIKRATCIPYVNLIFRHLALEPDVLAWAWETIGPLYHDGRIADSVTRFEASLPAATAAEAVPIWSGLAGADADQIRAVLAFYNRGNPANLVGLSTLVAAARRERSARSEPNEPMPASIRQPCTEAPRATIPPLPRPDQISPETLTLARELAARQSGAEMGVVPSLYLHISLWPEAMAAAHRIVLPAISSANWPQRVAATIAAARSEASDLCRSVRVSDARPPTQILDGYINTVDKFTIATIPEMVMIGRILAGVR